MEENGLHLSNSQSASALAIFVDIFSCRILLETFFKRNVKKGNVKLILSMKISVRYIEKKVLEYKYENVSYGLIAFYFSDFWILMN